MLLWRMIWVLGLPLILLYLRKRGAKDPLYTQHLKERFGIHARPTTGKHVWVHAVSLGELRSAVPLIQELLSQGEQIVTTHFTPAGRREAERVFSREISEGRLTPVWVPFDHPRPIRRFFKAFQPKYGLVMEVELWPAMILTARRAGISLFLCNGQYPSKSYVRDQKRSLSAIDLVPSLAGAMVKNTQQADRFNDMGLNRVAITGELRFEQPIPQHQIAAAQSVRANNVGKRHVITVSSLVKDEEGLFLDAIKHVKAHTNTAPLVILVPRAPERFSILEERLKAEGIHFVSRSNVFDEGLSTNQDLSGVDVILGDSMGEMYFYLELANRVCVGGGFSAQGSHNIIEALALNKPVIVGPHTWTIEFPVEEAIAAGVCQKITPNSLVDMMCTSGEADFDAVDFVHDHGGSVRKILDTVSIWTSGKEGPFE